LHGSRDRRASGRLRAEELHFLRLDQAELDQLVKRFLDLGDQRSASHRTNDVVRQTPSELLGNFKPYCLRSFRIVGTQVNINESPTVLVSNLRTEAVDLIVVSGDAHNL